jgi:hypothetical protein
MSGMKDLFGDTPVTFRGPPEQRENIARVHHKIAPAIIDYFRSRNVGYVFHVDDLRRAVAARYPGCAPDSAGRIMRDLRQSGLIDYAVINRRQSLYRITAYQLEAN